MSAIKIYARQVPPEYQESPLQMCEEYPEYTFIFGNRHFFGHRAEEIDAIREALEAIAGDLYCIKNRAHEDDEVCKIVRDHFPGRDVGGGYGVHDCVKLAGLALEFCDSPHDRAEEYGIIADALAVMHREPFTACLLHGCCQGDWQYCIYPASYGDSFRDTLAAEYFNTGTEWIIHEGDDAPEEPEDIDGYSMYCTSYDPRVEIADAHGVQPEEVQLYEFDGYTRRAIWKAV